MSDQNFFNGNINTDGVAVQAFDSIVPNANNIGPSTTVVDVDTDAGDIQVYLPEQVSSAGRQITVVNRTGANNVRVTPSDSDTIDGANASIPILSGTPYLSKVFVSLGAAGWSTS